MAKSKRNPAGRAFALAVVLAIPLAYAFGLQQAPAAPASKSVGTVKAISGNTVSLTTDSGAVVTIQVQDSTRMIRTAPGQKDLKNAAPVTLPELQIGDRMLVVGRPAADGSSVLASNIVVMKGTDVSAKQQEERDDWQKRGIGGLVTAIDPTGGTITVSTSVAGANKSVAVHVSKDTILRRYAPDSVKFEDAVPGKLDQVKVGDQLRARGNRSADGSELTAEEIVSGAFRNIAGTVISTDAASNSVKVMDLITKKPVTLKINSDSQLRSLPQPMAQRLAFQLKGGAPGGGQGAPANSGQPPASPAGQTSDANGRPRGSRDFQQMLSRMPAVALTDLQKDTAVMVVATEGSDSTEPTAITLLTGVEPILTAAPDKSRAAMLLSPWNLGGGDMGGEGNP